jgi:predicted nucleic acid-binding Zn finger protein
MPRIHKSTLLEKAEETVHCGGVKRHLFLPSRTEIWSIVGKEGEYLVSKDPPLCTCPAFYFSSARGKAQKCYHLISLEMAIATGNYFTIMGHDEEIFILLGLLL